MILSVCQHPLWWIEHLYKLFTFTLLIKDGLLAILGENFLFLPIYAPKA